MKSWTIPILYLGVALCLTNSARTYDKQNDLYKSALSSIRIDMSKVWNADTLIQKGDKHLYELVLPDSIIHKNLNNSDEIEKEYFDLKLKQLEQCVKFEESKNYETGINAIAYSQYLASRFPRNDGSELQRSACLIDEVSKMLRRSNIQNGN